MDHSPHTDTTARHTVTHEPSRRARGGGCTARSAVPERWLGRACVDNRDILHSSYSQKVTPTALGGVGVDPERWNDHAKDYMYRKSRKTTEHDAYGCDRRIPRYCGLPCV